MVRVGIVCEEYMATFNHPSARPRFPRLKIHTDGSPILHGAVIELDGKPIKARRIEIVLEDKDITVAKIEMIVDVDLDIDCITGDKKANHD
jgi:hypothetical protein